MSVQVKGSGTIGGLDEGLVVSGIVTSSTQINVGSNIKLGNAGVVTATTFSTANVDINTDKIVVGTGVTIEANQVATGQATFTGIVTASAFKLSDGSNVGGVESDAQENTLGGTNAGDSFSGTSALKNTLFGYDAGTAITTADVNTALGHSALKTNTQSSYNVAIGYESLKNFDRSDAGGQNTAVGWQSGDAMTSGRYNSLLGGASGGDITDGEQNSCFGYAAGRSITSGFTNTCIGYGAGKDSNQTGNNNIIIGNDAESSSTSLSN